MQLQIAADTWRIQTKSWVDLRQQSSLLPSYFAACYSGHFCWCAETPNYSMSSQSLTQTLSLWHRLKICVEGLGISESFCVVFALFHPNKRTNVRAFIFAVLW